MDLTPWDPEGAAYVLDANGRIATADAAGFNGLDLKAYYKLLVAARCLDVRLSSVGLPMWASAAGEEAPMVATALVAASDDWIYPGLRDSAVALARGMDYAAIAEQVVGRAERGGPALPGRVAAAEHRIATTTDGLGLHLPLAAGHAAGLKALGQSGVTFALFGEGVTTAGVFHETAMLAATGDLPLVLVCRSQLWPDGAPVEAGATGDPVADRGLGYGLFVRRVDGADPVCVHQAIAEAAGRARAGRGAGLVEVVVSQIVRDPPPHRDPIERLRRHLDETGVWTQTLQDVVEAEVRGKLEQAFATAEGVS